MLSSKRQILQKKMSIDYASTYAVIIGNNKIEFPLGYNMGELQSSNFFARIFKKTTLTKTQQNIIDCLYTVHWNGFVREHYLKKIILLNYEWVVPYVMQLVAVQ